MIKTIIKFLYDYGMFPKEQLNDKEMRQLTAYIQMSCRNTNFKCPIYDHIICNAIIQDKKQKESDKP